MKPKVSILMAVYEQEVLALKAIDSIPDRDDIEVIIIDDCSKDNTYELVKEHVKGRKNYHVYRNELNTGVAGTLSRALDYANGEYVTQLDCDDYYFTEALNRVIDQAEEDLVWFDMQVNNGDVWSPNIRKDICDHACLFKRTIIGEDRWWNVPNGGGWFLMQAVLKKPHTERYTNELAYCYNFPREGSILNLIHRGLM